MHNFLICLTFCYVTTDLVSMVKDNTLIVIRVYHVQVGLDTGLHTDCITLAKLA